MRTIHYDSDEQYGQALEEEENKEMERRTAIALNDLGMAIMKEEGKKRILFPL